MQSELERNIPNHPNWEGSFYEKLTECGEWNIDSFWLLHIELLNIAKKQKLDLPVERELSYMLLLIQQGLLGLIAAHFTKNDVFEISNIDNELLYEFKERFELAILGAITGEVLPETSFDLANPLLNNS